MLAAGGRLAPCDTGGVGTSSNPNLNTGNTGFIHRPGRAHRGHPLVSS